MDNKLGLRIQDYCLVEILGAGTFGVVYSAKNLRSGVVDRAYKIFNIFDESTRREAEVLSLLYHPNIISVYDFGKSHDFYYMSMELCVGNIRNKLNVFNMSG